MFKFVRAIVSVRISLLSDDDATSYQNSHKRTSEERRPVKVSPRLMCYRPVWIRKINNFRKDQRKESSGHSIMTWFCLQSVPDSEDDSIQRLAMRSSEIPSW